MSHSKISTRNPSQKRYVSENRRKKNKMRRVAKNNGPEAALLWEKQYG